MQKGQIEFVEIQSQLGGQCRLRNTWPDPMVTLYRDKKKAEELSGSLLKFSTVLGGDIVVVPIGSKPLAKKIL